MSVVAAFPTLSQQLAWPTEHLTEAADHWEAVAGRCYGMANQVWRDTLAVDWRGAAADTLRTETHSDMLTTSAVADQLHEAAKVARSGASDLYAARSRVRYAVQDARAAGFDVGEDMSVTDRSSGGSAAQRATRQAQAQAFAGDIRQRAVQLVGLDQQVAAKVTAAVAGIRHAVPPMPVPAAPAQGNRIQAVDNRTWKQDPTPAPPRNLLPVRAPMIFARCWTNSPKAVIHGSGKSVHRRILRTCGNGPNRTGWKSRTATAIPAKAFATSFLTAR
ncbi:hypothetical protein I546_5297 [Mycobacterium kansasii 732]|nr:hypothetical protein I546_5297 [Mycobacterium kansasii 732]